MRKTLPTLTLLLIWNLIYSLTLLLYVTNSLDITVNDIQDLKHAFVIYWKQSYFENDAQYII